MAERTQQVKRVRSDTGGVTQTTTSVTNDELPIRSSSTLAARVVWYIAGVIITLLAIRFVLILLGANRGNGFVDFIYNVSHPFAAPFFGIFGYNIQYGVSRVEFSTLLAIAIYALVAWGIARLVTIRQPQQG